LGYEEKEEEINKVDKELVEKKKQLQEALNKYNISGTLQQEYWKDIEEAEDELEWEDQDEDEDMIKDDDEKEERIQKEEENEKNETGKKEEREIGFEEIQFPCICYVCTQLRSIDDKWEEWTPNESSFEYHAKQLVQAELGEFAVILSHIIGEVSLQELEKMTEDDEDKDNDLIG
jgi:hypothetical protein